MSDTVTADILLTGPIFDGERVGRGYVAIANAQIIAVNLDGAPEPPGLVGTDTRIVHVPEGLITPGLYDDHTFFTSQLLEVGGIQAADLDWDALWARITESGDDVVVLLGIPDDVAAATFAAVTESFPDREFILLSAEREVCAQTPGSVQRVGAVDGQSNEGLAPLYALLASDPATVDAALDKFVGIATSNGVVGVKDIAFDQYLGMGAHVNARVSEPGFPLVMACASQPVLAPAALEFWAGARVALAPAGPPCRGFKLMTDGSFDEGGGALLEGSGRNNICDWDPEVTYQEARRIVAAGFPLILNADGDLAIRECVTIFEKLVEEFGELPAGCTVSDGSIMAPEDAVRIAALGLPVETYPQMVRFDYYSDEFLDEYLTPHGRTHFAPFDHVTNAGARILAATDFPLTEPSLPEAVLSASERLLPGDPTAAPIDKRGIERLAVLKAWTSNTADALNLAEYTGRIRVGDPANVAVFDVDLTSATPTEIADASVRLTIARGTITHEA